MILYLALLPVPVLAQTANVQYERGDGAFASKPVLAPESIDLAPGSIVEFDTDWKHEKQRTDGRNRYGSHLRRIYNKSTYMVVVYLRVNPTTEQIHSLYPNTTRDFRGDLIALEAAEVPMSSQDLNFRCQLIVERADNMSNGKGRPSASLGKEQFSLILGEMIVFNTDWKFEKNKSTPGERYGAHLRRATNKTPGATITLRTVPGHGAARLGRMVKIIVENFRGKKYQGEKLVTDKPMEFQADLLAATCSR